MALLRGKTIKESQCPSWKIKISKTDAGPSKCAVKSSR